MKYSFLLITLLLLTPLKGQQMADFLHIEAQVEPLANEAKVVGKMKVVFTSLAKQDSLFLDAKNMEIINHAMESVRVTHDEDRIWLHGPFEKGRRYTAFFTYEAFPQQAMYFTHDQVWTQGQGKYTSHWLPSLDRMTDKIEFDLTVVAPLNQTVVANGTLIQTQDFKGKKHWKFDMDHPMSSYLVALGIGDFDYWEEEVSNIPLKLYYQPEDSLKVEPTYRFTQEILLFLEKEIGIPFPWKTYKQVPIKDFLYAGMENTSVTFFSQAFMVDSIGFKDRNYVNVNAHEMAHQWFGNLVTETESTHHWLHEGFATYYALLAERKLFGEDYFYWKLYNTAEQLKAMSDQGKGEALLNPKASSLTYYEKGAWALHILKELIGDEAFHRGIKSYLERFAFQNVTTDDFLVEMEKHTVVDISQWKKDWLEQTAFKAEQAYNSLIKSVFIQNYFETSALRKSSLVEKRERLIAGIKSDNDFIGQEAVYQLSEEPIEETLPLYELALQQENVFTRQAVAVSMERIPESLKKAFETLLEDPSYVTQEAALYNLWLNFPDDRKTYLDRIDETIGFHDRNIRQLHLALAIYTNDYTDSQKTKFLTELQNYTGSEYSFEIREKAFELVSSMQMVNETVLKNLVNACTHHYWRFREAARNLLDDIMEEDSKRALVLAMTDQYNTNEMAYLKKKYDLK